MQITRSALPHACCAARAPCLALKRQLGVSCPIAWLLHQKMNRAMAQQDDTVQLIGAVQLDDAYLGGERAGGKAGLGSENKVPFVAAVSLNDKGHPLYLKLNLVSGFTSQAIAKWASANLVPGACVTSDGLGCFAAVADAGCIHMPNVVGALEKQTPGRPKCFSSPLMGRTPQGGGLGGAPRASPVRWSAPPRGQWQQVQAHVQD